MKQQWLWAKLHESEEWDEYPLGILYNYYERLLLFDTISKRNLDECTVSGITIYVGNHKADLLTKMRAIVTHNLTALEISIAGKENDISECVFGDESYFLN